MTAPVTTTTQHKHILSMKAPRASGMTPEALWHKQYAHKVQDTIAIDLIASSA